MKDGPMHFYFSDVDGMAALHKVQFGASDVQILILGSMARIGHFSTSFFVTFE